MKWKFWMIVLFLNLLCATAIAQRSIESIHYQKSLDYFNEGYTSQAISEINLFLKVQPNNVNGLMLRAYYYLELGENERALADYTQVLSINPKNDDALSNRALLFMKMNEYQNALTDINKRLELNQNDWSIYYDRAYCYGLNGDHNLAIKDFDKSISLNPNHAESYANRGFSKINDLSNEGLIRPAPEECIDACADLKKALQMGDSTVVQSIHLYCPD